MSFQWEMDPNAVYSCLLTRPWFYLVDDRVNEGVSAHLLQAWKDVAAVGSKIGCYELMIEIEHELQDLQKANAQRLGLSTDPIR